MAALAGTRRDRLELLHSLGTTSPPWCPVPSVVTVLDVIYHHFPETFPRAAQLGLRLVVPAGAKRADKVLAISEAGKRETAETLKIDPDHIEAIHLGFGFGGEEPAVTPAAELRERHGLGDAPLVLTVSSALRHKNLDRLLQAFAAA